MADSSAKKPRRSRKKAEPEPRGLTARQAGGGVPPAPIMRLMEAIEGDGGAVIGAYREPLGGLWQVMATLPIEKVEPTPYQRDLSAPHVARLAGAMEKLGRFVDPIIVVRTEDARYWTHTMEGPDDMPAHVKASLLGASLSLPVADGRLALGTWQGIYLCEHRDDGGPRSIVATLLVPSGGATPE